MEERLVGKDLIREILANIHESLKWMWQIVMALALVKGIEIYAESLDLSNVTNPFALFSVFYKLETLIFVSFILTFIRIYFGDVRHLDLGYKETQYHHGLLHEIEKYSGFYRLLDIFLLITNAVLFYFLAIQIDRPESYLYFYVLFLSVNVLWLLPQFLVSYLSGKNQSEILIDGMNRYQPLLIWSLNNFVFIFFVASFAFVDINRGVLYGILATILNSIIDFKFTWEYYFPDLKKMYHDSQKH